MTLFYTLWCQVDNFYFAFKHSLSLSVSRGKMIDVECVFPECNGATGDVHMIFVILINGDGIVCLFFQIIFEFSSKAPIIVHLKKNLMVQSACFCTWVMSTVMIGLLFMIFTLELNCQTSKPLLSGSHFKRN